MDSERAVGIGIGTFIAWAVLGVIVLGMWGCPHWHVYQQKLAGEGELSRAESSRRITVLEAQAKLDSAAKLAEAEIARAHGVAEANKIIGASLTGNESYLHYLWINELAAAGHVIYVPTEANLPILEARSAQPAGTK